MVAILWARLKEDPEAPCFTFFMKYDHELNGDFLSSIR
jgi:hypothetical protein